MRLFSVRLVLSVLFVLIGAPLIVAAFIIGGPGFVIELLGELRDEAEQDWFHHWPKINLWRWGP